MGHGKAENVGNPDNPDRESRRRNRDRSGRADVGASDRHRALKFGEEGNDGKRSACPARGGQAYNPETDAAGYTFVGLGHPALQSGNGRALFQGVVVDVDVLAGGGGPVEVLGHGLLF